jgi:GR25 family glycosyltransferase involved in LPS biosynthesis
MDRALESSQTISFENKKHIRRIHHMLKIINLKTDKIKLANIKANFDQHNIENEIFNGIDGLDYTLTDADMMHLQNVDYNIFKQVGVVGCHLSHIRLLEQFINDTTLNHMIVCEDNIQVTDHNFNDVVNRIMREDFDIVYMYCGLDPTLGTKPGKHVTELYSLYNCTHRWCEQGTRIYMISRTGAKKVLSAYYKGECRNAIDYFMLSVLDNSMALYPNICKYDNTSSSISVRGGH